jgi:hypothetical protein
MNAWANLHLLGQSNTFSLQFEDDSPSLQKLELIDDTVCAQRACT